MLSFPPSCLRGSGCVLSKPVSVDAQEIADFGGHVGVLAREGLHVLDCVTEAHVRQRGVVVVDASRVAETIKLRVDLLADVARAGMPACTSEGERACQVQPGDDGSDVILQDFGVRLFPTSTENVECDEVAGTNLVTRFLLGFLFLSGHVFLLARIVGRYFKMSNGAE